MFASVEMLLKFCVEKFFSEPALANNRKKRASSQHSHFFVVRIPHWR